MPAPVDLRQKGDEVRAALGLAGLDDEVAPAQSSFCSSSAITGDLPAMIRIPAQSGAGNYEPYSLVRPDEPV
jgi:hypothetical protein